MCHMGYGHGQCVYLTESASSARIPTDENKVQFVRAARVHKVQLLLSLDDGLKESEYCKNYAYLT